MTRESRFISISGLARASACLLVLLITSPGWGAEWKLEPGVSWRGTYDDNVLFKDASDYESRINPALQVSRRDERSSVDMTGLLNIIRYLDNSAYDRENQNYNLAARYAVSPRFSLNLASRLGIDYTFDEYWEEEGIVTDRGKRYTWNASPGMRFALSERSALDFSVFYNKVHYEQELNPDYDVLGGNLTLSHVALGGRATLFVVTALQQAVYDLGSAESRQRVYRLMLGGTYRFTETLDLSLRAGPLYTESKYDHPFFTIEEDDLSYAVEGSLNWRRERTRFNLNLDRSEAQSTYGENIINNRLRAGMTHDLSPRWRVRLSGGYAHSETEGLRRKSKSQSLNLDTGLAYILTETMDVSLGYNYRRSENRITDVTDTGNRAYVMFAVRFPYVW